MISLSRTVALLLALSAGSSALAASPVQPRVRYTINEQWVYASGPIEGAERIDLDDRDWERVNLPHTWNAVDAFDKTPGYRRGLGWYRKRLDVDGSLRGNRLYLYFEGANQIADVYVNGRHAGQHIGGYTAFVFDITEIVTFDRPNTIAVRVDNSHNPDVPPLNADFTFYGGIYRDVWLLATSPIHFTVIDHASPGVFVDTPQVSESSAVVRVFGTVVNQSDRQASVRVLNRILDKNGREVASTSSRLRVDKGASARFEQRTNAIARPQLWSPERPYVYRVRTELYDGARLLDLVDNPLGFRWFRLDASNGFILNGKPLKLSGTNRHQDHDGLGNALPDRYHHRDIQLIKDNGFNFLRLAHYPQDPALLESTDRLGLAVWEEIPVVNLIGTSAAFAENSERMLVEMIRQHYNHPSIIFWGYMNEVLFTTPDPLPDRYYEKLLELARRLEARVHQEDPHRATVMAFERDDLQDHRGLLGIPQIAGFNLYFGWYYQQIEALGPFLDEAHRNHPTRPLIVSEYGADSDERLHTRNPKPYDFSSEQAQGFHVESFPQIEARKYLLGSAVWNQFDFGSELRHDTKHALNQKGLYYFDRTPKDSAFYYRAALRDEPLLHIAREWNMRAGSRRADRSQPVWVYTNLEEVELIVNGSSAGSRKVVNRTAAWTVELKNGTNRILARGKGIEDQIDILYDDRTQSTSSVLAVNCGTEYAYNDGAGVVWEGDRSYSQGGWGHVGGEEAKTNHRIFGTSDDPLFQSSREGAEKYQFDLPDGVYEVQLGFAEGKSDAVLGDRLFSVFVNSRELVSNQVLARYTAQTRTTRVEVANGSGIAITFAATKGKASIASILIRRIY